jgi:hypothetical protein
MINKRQKTTKLVLALAVALVLPVVTSAQGLFRHGIADEDYYGFGGTEKQISMFNRSVIEPNGIIDNQTFGQSPIGSGIIILLAAGAGYATLKRRKEDKQ